MSIEIKITVPDFDTAGGRIDPDVYFANAMAALGYERRPSAPRGSTEVDGRYSRLMGSVGLENLDTESLEIDRSPSAFWVNRGDEEVRVATPAESEAWADKVVAEAVPLTEDPAPKKRGRPRKSEPAPEATEAPAPLEGEVLPPEPKPEPEKPEAPVIEAKAVTAEPITFAACRERVMALAIDFPDSPQISRSIMNEMGYGKLSELPPERYGELLERVEAAVKGS